MSTKNQAKSRHTIQKSTEDEDEVIEIEEIPTKPIKNKVSQKSKEMAENSSSEATTPNKKKQKKKKKESDLIEIMDIEIPEIDLEKKKVSSPPLRQKKSISKLSENKEKKDEKLSVQSVNKIDVRKKSPFNKEKKGKQSASITLDESDGDENEIKVTTEVKIGNSKSNKKNSSKVTRKKSINSNSKEIAIVQVKKNKKNVVKNGKNNKKNNQEIELLSEESDNDKRKENITRIHVQKRKKYQKDNVLTPNLCTDNVNSGYLSSRKMSHKKEGKSYEKDGVKSKSTIKVSLKEDKIEKKMKNLLGRKRKPDKKVLKSITPNKKSSKSENSNKKSSTPIPTKKTPSQVKLSKAKSRTPFKNIGKKNNKNHDLFDTKMEIEEKKSKKNLVTPELAVLEQLVNEYGLERVLDSLCNSKSNHKNKLDSCIQGLKDSCLDNKINFIVCKMIFSYFESKFNEQEKKFLEKKRATSVNKFTPKKIVRTNSKKSTSKSPIRDTKSIFSVMDQCEGGSPIKIDEEENQESKKNENNEKKINSLEKNKSKNIANVSNEEEKKTDKKMMSIGSHYNKNEEGEIFKYQVASLDGKGNAIFKCYDDKCCGMGTYELETRKFEVTKKHNLKNAEHEYIFNNEKDGDDIIKQLIDKNKSNAQVFKENGERIVRYY